MSSQIAIVGAGYVGLPLAVAFAEAGRDVVCMDTDPAKVEAINAGTSYVEDVPGETLAELVGMGRLRASTDPAVCADADAVLLCLPTPLSTNREPDLSILEAAAHALAGHLRPGQLIVLESTTYPGTTREVLAPILEQGGLAAGRDFHLAMSPERIDPGRTDWTVKTTPKVVGGLTSACTERAVELYSAFAERLVPVSSCEAAELTKLLENIFRSVNIALVNELAMLCHRMGLDVWEVVGAAATKPYGFMPFSPGPGLGGHCLPIDPFYLSWKAREYDFPVEFIELAGKVNQHMPYYCAERVAQALNDHAKAVRGSSILILGVSYKSDVGDLRESPALKLIELLREAGAEISYHDPHVPSLAPESIDLASVELTDDVLQEVDAVCVVTAHAAVDHARIAERARLVVDFRNAVPERGEKVVAL
ncbi:MAG TPA: nucleotide sugar dehydrogenase [Gaiellales bacterium]|jgi:UDP-N-acetyl-D-glucosamine dehydrogenase|nr:nucleotide sugar dehydrogenase [Gaiellales bacterium]